MTRLWHDNFRPPPPDWTWAKTNHEAKEHLKSHNVSEASLDYNMGHETGYELAKWMVFHGHLPEKIIIHSTNPHGADVMAGEFMGTGSNVRVEPAFR